MEENQTNTDEQELTSEVEDFGNITRHRLIWGVGGVFLWMLIFSAGVLIPSEPSRKNLGWTGNKTSAVATTPVAETHDKVEKPPIICDFYSHHLLSLH